jgi:cytochrome c551/c552
MYVVKDWGVAGSNDTVSPMPAVNAAPIEMTDIEIDAVIAYLQHKDGNEITVELPDDAPAVDETQMAEAGNSSATVAGMPAAAENAEAAIKKYGCQACHTLLGASSPVGPSLEMIGTRLDKQQIQQSIIEPGEVIAEGYANIMPADFAEKMTVKELSMIVDLLAGLSEQALSEEVVQ